MRGPPVGISLLALALIAAPMVTLALADGGAPPERDGRSTTWAPRLEAWSFVATGRGENAGLLCSQDTACDFDAMKHHAAEEHACAWTGRIWLATGAGFPLVVRNPSILVYAVGASGDGERLPDGRVNVSSHLSTFNLTSPDDAWWRLEEERVHVAVPAPCDLRELQVTLNWDGRTLAGKSANGAQTVEVTLVPW